MVFVCFAGAFDLGCTSGDASFFSTFFGTENESYLSVWQLKGLMGIFDSGMANVNKR
jgi:hypothetical protein